MLRDGERTDVIYIINQRLEKLERDLNKTRNDQDHHVCVCGRVYQLSQLVKASRVEVDNA